MHNLKLPSFPVSSAGFLFLLFLLLLVQKPIETQPLKRLLVLVITECYLLKAVISILAHEPVLYTPSHSDERLGPHPIRLDSVPTHR